jgi:DNA-directed RNA polymerase subunit beta
MKKTRGIIDKLFFSDQRYNLGEVGRYRMNKKLGLISQWKSKFTKEDIITIVKYLIELINAKADIDDIDHLSNRRKNSWRTIVSTIRCWFSSYG